MDVSKRERTSDDWPEESTVSLESFLRAMEVLLKQKQGADLGSLSVMALSRVNKRLRYYTEAYRKTPKYWIHRFQRELLPSVKEEWWRYYLASIGDGKEHLAIKEVELIQFQNRALTKWRNFTPDPESGKKEINYFFAYLAHLIVFLILYRLSPNNRTKVVELIWKDSKQSFRLTVEMSQSDDHDGVHPQVGRVLAYNNKNGNAISYASWMYKAPIWKFLLPYLRTGNVSGTPYSFVPPPYGAIDAIQFVYRALAQGWLFSTEIKEQIPSRILACLNCGETALPLQQCGGCLSSDAVYCGASCQQDHWHQHKHDCKWKK